MSQEKDFYNKIAEINATLDRLAKLIADGKAEADRRQAEADRRQAEADRRQAEADHRQAEADRRQAELDVAIERMSVKVEETSAKVEATTANTDRVLAGIHELYQIYKEEGDRWGKISESLLLGGLSKIMLDRFNIRLSHVGGNITFENMPDSGDVDVIGVNGDLVVAVEVKTTLARSDITKFKGKVLDNFATLLPEYKDRKIYGGVAYIKTAGKLKETDVVAHAENIGLFVIKIIGDSNKIVNSTDFKLRDHR